MTYINKGLGTETIVRHDTWPEVLLRTGEMT